MVTLTIDGKEVTVPKGTTILQAAEKAGVRIPTLCHDKRLIPFGACRLCVVEIKGWGNKLIPACFNPVRGGTEVLTNTERVREARRMQLQLILRSHPLDCPVCDKAGECELQNLVYEYGVADNPFVRKTIHFPVDYVSPMVQRDMNRCILCGSCVRICNELQGVAEISFVNRGVETIIGTDFNRPMNCEFCGQCISVCPTGALNNKLFKFTARVWELKNIETVCSYCSCGCSMVLGTKDGEIKRVDTEYDLGSNEGNLCVKGRFGFKYVNSPDRLKTPLVRQSGELKAVSWEEALGVIAGKLNSIKSSDGPQAIGCLAGARLTNEEAYLLQKLMRSAIGSNNIDNSAGYSYQGILSGLKPSLGYASSTIPAHEIRNADVVFLLRANLTETNPVTKIHVNLARDRNHAKLIVADCINTRLMFGSDVPIVYKPGSEVALMGAMAQVIISEDLYDKEFVAANVEGFEELKGKLAGYSIDKVAEITGVPAETIQAAARTYAAGNQACVVIATGQAFRGDEAEIAAAAANLALLCGQIGKPSSGIVVMAEKCNSQGVLDMGLTPGYLPDFKAVSEAGLDALEMLKQAEAGKVKALYIVGENPVVSYPGRQQTEAALKNLDLLVVEDMFLTDTAKMADVVLPAAAFAEKEGTFTNADRYVQKLKPALDPPGEAKADLEIIQALSNKLGFEMAYDSSSAVMEEIGKQVSLYAGVELGKMNGKGMYWPVSEGADLYSGGFGNKAKLTPIDLPEAKNSTSKDFPYILVPGVTKFHSGSFSLSCSDLLGLGKGEQVYLNVADAATLKVVDGDAVKISSPNGTIERVVEISDAPPEGVVYLPYHHSGNGLAYLTAKDDKQTAVKIEKA